MKLKYSIPFIWLVLHSSAAFATCTQPSGSYSGVGAGVQYTNGQLSFAANMGVVLTFTSPTQGSLFQFFRFGSLGTNPPPPGWIQLSGTFPAQGTNVTWYPAPYCLGVMTIAYTNPPNPGPLTTTFVFTSSQSGQILTLTYVAGTFSGGLTDNSVGTNTLVLRQQ